MAWIFDLANIAYRQGAEIFGVGDMKDLSRTSRDASMEYILNIGQKLIDKALSPAQLGELVKQELKEEYIREYILARGGITAMMPADWGSIGGNLAFQYKYLDKFMAEIERGEVSEAMILQRLKLYENFTREIFNVALSRTYKDAGYTAERWVLGTAEHCADCLDLSGQGWQEIGFYPIPGSGSTICLSNCQCSIEYAKPKEESFRSIIEAILMRKWTVKKSGEKYCVYKEGDNKPLKCYDNKVDADAYQKALYANTPPGEYL